MGDRSSGDGRHVVFGRFSGPHSNCLATFGVLLFTLFALLPGGDVLCADPDRGRLSGDDESHRQSRNRGDDKTQSDGNLATSVETRDGVFVVYDAGLPPDNQPETRAYLAYWYDFETEELYVYGRVLNDRVGIWQALLNLERDLWVPPATIARGNRSLDGALNDAASAVPDATQWYPATRNLIRQLLQCSERGEDSDDSSTISCACMPVMSTAPVTPDQDSDKPPAGREADRPLRVPDLTPWPCNLVDASIRIACACGGGPPPPPPPPPPCDGGPDPNDIDCDGIPNDEDDDVDGDGIPNGEDPDVDGDGILNGDDDDVDGDGILNGDDPDVDGDGILNGEDDDIDGDGVLNGDDDDVDGDGILNGDDPDVDGDGLLNGDDPDVDGDGILNGDDPDVDGDGLLNGDDPDVDGDGIDNGNDSDVDGDGVDNGEDSDVDGDGISNGSDPDIDGDGILNGNDNDMDGDGSPNAGDSDCRGQCVGGATGGACGDCDPCTINEACSNGVCTGPQKSCNDSNECTENRCDSNTGECFFPPKNCDDSKVCTFDCCDPATATGCEHFASAQPCSARNFEDQPGCPGSNVTVTADVCNDGACDKTFTWTMTQVGGTTPVTFVSPSSGSISVPGNTCVTVSVTVSLSAGSVAGLFADLKLEAVSTPDEQPPPVCIARLGATAADPVPCSATARVTVVDVNIAPTAMTTIEGLDSANYTATLTNAAVTAYAWDWDAPAGAGNNPTVNFSASAAQSTNVIRAHWFADPDDRHWLVTGDDCSYDIKCDVTHPDGICTGDAVFNVDADPTGSTTWPQFSGWATIVIATRPVGTDTEWYVNGQGGFTRTAPVKTINCVATSQFYAKVDAHESKHVTQFTSELPWMNLWHADNLYNNTLVNLTSLVSEADLRTQIAAAVTAQDYADEVTMRDTVCAHEIAAFTVDRAVEPHYCEVDDAEVPLLYNCTP